jgi:hypothetical protein
MILIIPIFAYLVIIVGIIFFSNKVLKNKSIEKRKRNCRWIIIFASILFPILGFLYFSFLFGIALDDHYDVKKGTFLWYATMDNKTITEFPIQEPIENKTYNKIGGDGPNIATGWKIEYESKANIETLTKKIVEYIESEGYKLKTVDETQFYWKGKNKKDEMNILYAGSNATGESLDLLFHRQKNGTTRIECSIVW